MSAAVLGLVLDPYDKREACRLKEAAVIAGRSEATIRSWCAVYRIGRRIGGRWEVSRVALAMFMDGKAKALEDYLNGDRAGPLVAPYFVRIGLR